MVTVNLSTTPVVDWPTSAFETNYVYLHPHATQVRLGSRCSANNVNVSVYYCSNQSRRTGIDIAAMG